MAVAGAIIPPLNQRPEKGTILLFDVDGTLSLARRVCTYLQTSSVAWKIADT
jgi:hypothetical protein